MYMKEPDSLDDLLREEWKAPEPSAELDQRVTSAYRSEVRRPAAWKQFWKMRVSVPAPALLVAAVAIVALVAWLRPATPPAPAQSPGVVTQLNASGFQPLPNGEARVVLAVEIVK
jgi:hypothetical protein